VVALPLAATAVATVAQTDTFEMDTGGKLDLLFVVDNSAWMGAYQNELSKAAVSLLKALKDGQIDYQVGVTSTDMKGGLKGKLRMEAGIRFLTHASGAMTELPKYLKLGSNGSANEQGLEAARRALSLPLAFDTCDGKCQACVVDKDCSANMFCVPDAGGAKACGGWNRAFWRKGAQRAVVFLSNAQDNSPFAVSSYVQLLKNIDGPPSAKQVSAHAIVGLGKAKDSGCELLKGNRYLSLVAETAGTSWDICAKSYEPAMKGIAQSILSEPRRFKLSAAPQPSTIKVGVAGKPCPGPNKSTWTYDASTDTVVLAGAGPGSCLPGAGLSVGTKVTVSYTVDCLPKAP